MSDFPPHPKLKVKIQIFCDDEIAFGPGKADLLDAIRAHGSISAAARKMGMSYRRAWMLVDVMNRCWHSPLVVTAPGNARGGGAQLTPCGDTVLQHYRTLQHKADGVSASSACQELEGLLRDHPKEKQHQKT
ncbi:MAG: winged helix-turn-helix domain-containing protein [Sphingomonadaceae bacterium]